jgi:hypothetical protein
MKKIFVIFLLSTLAGCATFADLKEAYLMKYDTNEYQQIADIRTTASLAKLKCDNFQESKDNAIIISAKVRGFKQFVEYMPYNSKVITASVELDKMAQGVKEFYEKNEKVSLAFCKIKFDNIERSAETMQKTIGAKPR